MNPLMRHLEAEFGRVIGRIHPESPTDAGLTVDEITTDGLQIGNADLPVPEYDPPGEPERVPALVDFPKSEAFK